MNRQRRDVPIPVRGSDMVPDPTRAMRHERMSCQPWAQACMPALMTRGLVGSVGWTADATPPRLG